MARYVVFLRAVNVAGHASVKMTDAKLYVVFLSRKPRVTPSLPIALPKEALEIVAIDGREVFVVSQRKTNGMYGFPNNFVEKELDVSATTRNWSTVTKIVALCRGLS